MPGQHIAVALRDVLDAAPLAHLEVLHLSPRAIVVSDLALITDIEDIAAVGPDTVVVLTEQVALGGWMVSAALRYAWERRAAAVIVPQSSFTGTVVDLARRLDVSMLSSDREVTRVALDVAMQIGVLQAGVHARVARLSDQLFRAGTIDAVVSTLSRGLGGVAVHAEVGGIPVATAGAPQPRTVVVEAHTAADADIAGARLVAHVAERDRDAAEEALRVAAPVLRALVLREELRAASAAFPVLSLVALAGGPGGAQADPAPPAAPPVRGAAPRGRYAALFLHAAPEDVERLAAPVYQVWRRSHPGVALARVRDGWLAFVPLAHDAREPVVPRDLLPAADLGLLWAAGVSAGLSRAAEGEDRAAANAAQAWLAARLAPGEAGLAHARVMPPLLDRLLPASSAEGLLRGLFPRLIADPHARELAAAATAYLDCAGSVSRAATRLGVHRNTVQTRLRQAAALGLDLADPDAALGVHLLLASWLRSPAPRPGADPEDHHSAAERDHHDPDDPNRRNDP